MAFSGFSINLGLVEIKPQEHLDFLTCMLHEHIRHIIFESRHTYS